MKVGGLQIGGGINSDNSLSYIEEGASHVIVTSVCYNFFYKFLFNIYTENMNNYFMIQYNSDISLSCQNAYEISSLIHQFS